MSQPGCSLPWPLGLAILTKLAKDIWKPDNSPYPPLHPVPSTEVQWQELSSSRNEYLTFLGPKFNNSRGLERPRYLFTQTFCASH